MSLGKHKSKPHWSTTSTRTPTRTTTIKKIVTSVGEDVEKLEPLYIVDENLPMVAAALGNSLPVSQNVKWELKT